MKAKNGITKKQIIEFVFDFKEIKEYQMKRMLRKPLAFIIDIANAYENDKNNYAFYRTLLLS